MAKDDNTAILTEFDRFGQPVTLTYKNNPSYNTAAGGFMTMIVTLILGTWFALEVFEVYMPPGKHAVGTSWVVTQHLNGSWPLEQIHLSDFFIGY